FFPRFPRPPPRSPPFPYTTLFRSLPARARARIRSEPEAADRPARLGAAPLSSRPPERHARRPGRDLPRYQGPDPGLSVLRKGTPAGGHRVAAGLHATHPGPSPGGRRAQRRLELRQPLRRWGEPGRLHPRGETARTALPEVGRRPHPAPPRAPPDPHPAHAVRQRARVPTRGAGPAAQPDPGRIDLLLV